jgi:hypothetical protein
MIFSIDDLNFLIDEVLAVITSHPYQPTEHNKNRKSEKNLFSDTDSHRDLLDLH